MKAKKLIKHLAINFTLVSLSLGGIILFMWGWALISSLFIKIFSLSEQNAAGFSLLSVFFLLLVVFGTFVDFFGGIE